MKTLLLTILLTTASCATLDNYGDTSRTDAVTVRATVVLSTADTVAAKCHTNLAIACHADHVMYIQGEPVGDTSSALIHVQYLSWGDLGDKCGRVSGTPSCYEGNTLYTSSTYSITNESNNGAIGDILADLLKIDVGYNRRSQLGHEFQHVLGQKDAPFVDGASHVGTW